MTPLDRLGVRLIRLGYWLVGDRAAFAWFLEEARYWDSPRGRAVLKKVGLRRD